MTTLVEPMTRQMKPAHLRRQHGSTAVEFAMIFPIFFIVLYGIVTFSMIFVAQQSLTLAAEEGARAALTYQKSDTPPDALALRVNAVCPVAKSMLAPMVATADCQATTATCNAGMQCVNVVISYAYGTNPLIPSLPLMGDVLPKTLTSSATIQLNPLNLL